MSDRNSGYHLNWTHYTARVNGFLIHYIVADSSYPCRLWCNSEREGERAIRQRHAQAASTASHICGVRVAEEQSAVRSN